MSTLRERFLKLATDKPKLESVVLAEPIGTVYVKVMTGSERDQFESWLSDSDKRKDRIDSPEMRAKLLVLTLCDEEGKRLFSKTDVGVLGSLPYPVIEPAVTLAAKLNKLGKEEAEAAEGN